MTTIYQLGLARWVEHAYGELAHFGVEVVFYGTMGPLVAFGTLTLIGHWLDEKEHVERQARTSERRLASITAASADAILGLDATGRIEFWNRGAELLFGYSAQDIHGRSLDHLMVGSEQAQADSHDLVQAVQQAGFIREREATCWDVHGRQIAVELTATRLPDEAGQPVGMSVILRDITQRKRREHEIRRLNASLNKQVAERTQELAEKIEELARANAHLQQLDTTRSEFVALVSHQIRAPLTNVRGAIERMQSNCHGVNGTCSRMFAILDQQSVQLDFFVRDVLNATRIEAGELMLYPEPISVLPVVQQVVAQIRARAADRPFRLSAQSGLPLALADRDRITDVLTNLLDNADKYSPRGQEVVIEAQASGTEIVLSVRDFGCGLPPNDLERVFDKFYRANNNGYAYGYGLGLYVCRQLVEAHGGRIWVENAPGGGATFSFTLPVAR